MTDGISVAKDTKQATDTDPNNLLFSSTFLSPKIYKQGNGSLTTDASGNGTASISHDLTYSPVYLVYINPCRSIVREVHGPGSPDNIWGLIDNNFSFVTSTPQLLKLDIQNSQVNKVYNFSYFIFVDPSSND